MSPAQAAHRAGTSRWTIMRAVKSGDLKAIRDNRNRWRIEAGDLDAWRSHTPHTVRAHPGAHPDAHPPAHPDEPPAALREELAALRERVEGLTARAEAAEQDRDAWRRQSEALAEALSARRLRRGWWPWRQAP